MKKLARVAQKLFFGINILTSGLLLLASFISYVTFKALVPLSILSLIVPILFTVNLIFLLYWLVRRKRKLLLPLTALLIGFFSFGSFYKLGSTNKVPSKVDLKIMTFNVRGFNEHKLIEEPDIGERILNLISAEAPDIICTQEHGRKWYNRLPEYQYRTQTYHSAHRVKQAIFSKYPIIGSGTLDLPGTFNNIIFADVEHQKDTIRIYNVHLQSFKIVPSPHTFSEGESEKNYRRLIGTFGKQLDQVDFFNKHRKNNRFKTLICGDFNNTQFSNVYRSIKGDAIDTFLEKGKGFGKTYNLLGFPLRIDYILTDPEFEVIAHKNYEERLSDHYPVMATLRLKE